MLRDQKDILINYLVENKYLNVKTIPNSSDFVFYLKSILCMYLHVYETVAYL